MIVGADENAIVTQSRINVATHQTGHTIEFWGQRVREHVAGAVSADQGGCAPQSKEHPSASHWTPDRARRRLRVPGTHRWHDEREGHHRCVRDSGARRAATGAGGLSGCGRLAQPLAERRLLQGLGRWPRSNGTGSWRRASPRGLRSTRGHLAQAVSNGAACEGTWIARPGTLGCHPLKPFDESFVRPPALPQSIKVLAWQAVLECQNLDFSILNPAFDAATLGKFVLPTVPALAVVAAVPKPRAAPKARKKRAPKPKTGRTARKKRATKSKTKRTARKKGSRAKRR